ncbi:MAG: L-threonylcarbamoyladenylate synthase [Bacteroidota bacterium]
MTIERSSPADEVVRSAAEVLRKDGVIIYPTETLYGFGARADSPSGVRRILDIKGRGKEKGMILLVPSAQFVQKLAAFIPQFARALMEAFWPGPLTLIFQADPSIAKDVVGESGTVGVRLSSEPFCRMLLNKVQFAITSTSVNYSGQPPLCRSTEIREKFADAVDLIIDAGDVIDDRPSTVVSCTEERPKLIREGRISKSQIESVLRTLL